MKFTRVQTIFLFCACLSAVLFVILCLFGSLKKREFIVLFQNNYELRPTGGFLGSYGRLTIDPLGKQKYALTIQDIYVPDGQLLGHVDPPWPIQAAFGQGWFRLRDSNFDPDFPTSAKTMLWFFEKGKENPVNGIIAVNLEVYKEIISTIGPISIPDEKTPLTVENFYERMQTAAEIGFFPGSQQKQVYLSKAGRATLSAIQESSSWKKIQLAMKLGEMFMRKQIMMFTTEKPLQQMISLTEGAGEVKRKQGNYFSFFEANLGTNKANCCIDRSLAIKKSADVYTATITLSNHNPQSLKNPPLFWGGAYVNYMQVYIPIEAHILHVTVGDIDRSLKDDLPTNATKEPITLQENWRQQLATNSAMKKLEVTDLSKKGLKKIGFFVIVDAGETTIVRLSYSYPDTVWSPRRIFVQKQSGVLPYAVLINEHTELLKSDRFFTLL